MDETQGFLYLAHSNWTICSLLSWFCYIKFPSSWSLYRGKWEKGIHPKMDETQGFMYLGHSYWTISSLLNWFCSQIFPSSLSFYWGVQFLITPECGYEKKGFTQKWMRHRGFYTWGIQNGPFEACWADFVPKFFHHPDLHTGESNSLLPQRVEMRKKDSPKNGWDTGISVLGTLKLDHLQTE